MNRPYISFVACSRNDDHGGGTWERMTASLACTFHQLEKHGVPSEYIMVDWNPPPDRPRLKEAVSWPENLTQTSIRIIEVEPEIHRRYKRHRLWNLFSPLAYNVGLRRARGEFSALSMIDHLYSDRIMSLLASRSLNPDRAYRCPRADVRSDVVNIRGVPEQLDYCSRNLLTTAEPPGEPLHPDLPPLFTQACGDFQLLATDVWHRLRGYRERDLMPQHVDSFVHYAAHAMGIREEVRMDLPLYHIDHSGGWKTRIGREKLGSIRFGRRYIPPAATVSEKIASIFFRMLLLETKPLVNEEIWPYYRQVFVDLGLGRMKHDFNDENWGLAGEDLHVIDIHKGDWES